MSQELTIAVDTYRCEPCSQKQGVEVTELVRMMPRAAVVFGKLIGDEYWCCPICFESKFPVKTSKPKATGKPAAPRRAAKGRGKAIGKRA